MQKTETAGATDGAGASTSGPGAGAPVAPALVTGLISIDYIILSVGYAQCRL